MNTDDNIPYALLAKYFSNQASLQEKEKVHAWCNENTQNKQSFDLLQKQWHTAHSKRKASVIPDKEKVWNKIQKKITRIPMYSRFVMLRTVGIAATIALLLGVSLPYWFNLTIKTPPQEMHIYTQYGQKSQMVLPDGTQVWLNGGSSIAYPSDFNTNNRHLKLDGEAYFDVTKSSENPFIVKTKGVDVHVLGTQFNVRAYADNENISVALVSGRIDAYTANKQQLLAQLYPNQLLSVNKNNMKSSVLPCDAAIEAIWHQNKLFINNLSYADTWKSLEKWYGVRIKTKNSPSDLRYYFTVKTETLTELLTLINRLTAIDFQINGEEVNISYK